MTRTAKAQSYVRVRSNGKWHDDENRTRTDAQIVWHVTECGLRLGEPGAPDAAWFSRQDDIPQTSTRCAHCIRLEEFHER
jgi:hypothetical protein